MSATPTPSWWHKPASPHDPLQVVRLTLEAIQAGQPIPATAANALADALNGYLAGKTDLTKNLGLRPKRGYRVPAKVARQTERDELIKKVVDAQPQSTPTERAKSAAKLLAKKDGPINEVDVMAHLIKLHKDFGDELPTTWRRIFDITRETR